ncbi:MAG: CoA-binding protein [Cyclobacteriaceae bacterium]
MSKKTIILGASNRPDRYAFQAAMRLKNAGHPFVPLSIKSGDVLGEEMINLREQPSIQEVDTITVYMNEHRQSEWEDYIISLKPKRIIFNPGAENQRLAEKAESEGIETINACTLVMLGIGNY